MLSIFATTLATVLLAEVLGDKLVWTTGVLATRFRWTAVVAGMGIAFALKMLAAVLLGELLATVLPRGGLALATALGFAGSIWAIRQQTAEAAPGGGRAGAVRGAAVAFGTIFLSEWGDPGMLAAAAMSSRYAAEPGGGAVTAVVWAGAVGAMIAKGTLAGAAGTRLRAWANVRFEPARLRALATAALVVLGSLTVMEVAGVLSE